MRVTLSTEQKIVNNFKELVYNQGISKHTALDTIVEIWCNDSQNNFAANLNPFYVRGLIFSCGWLY